VFAVLEAVVVAAGVVGLAVLLACLLRPWK
jgi:hypothetical protein